jgi:hypothetical protein
MLNRPRSSSRVLRRYVDGQLRAKYGDAFIRGNNVMWGSICSVLVAFSNAAVLTPVLAPLLLGTSARSGGVSDANCRVSFSSSAIKQNVIYLIMVIDLFIRFYFFLQKTALYVRGGGKADSI